MGDGPLTQKQLSETTEKWRAYRAEIGMPVEAPAPAAAQSVNEHDTKLVLGVVKGIAPVIFELEQKIAKLEQRISELERKGYVGVWREGKEYSPQSEVTHDGARWLSHKRTTDKPGRS